MYIKSDFSFEDLKDQCWGGAEETLKIIEEHNKEELLLDLLENDIFFEEIPTITEVNDYLAFEDEFIFDCLQIEIEEDWKKGLTIPFQ